MATSEQVEETASVLRCEQHQKIASDRGDALVDPVLGPVAKVSEWGRSRGVYPDGCPGTEWAHYSLYYKGHYVADTSTPEHAEVLREIAIRLNRDEADHG